MDIVTSVYYKDWNQKSKLASMPIAAASFCTIQASIFSPFRLFLLLAFIFYNNAFIFYNNSCIHTYSYENIKT